MPAGEAESVGRRDPGVPRAPWGAFPLSELLVVLAVVFAAYGVLSWGSARGIWAVGAAMTLGCLAGLEVAIREHLAGYRPHSTVLAGSAAILSGTATFLLGVPAAIALGLTVLVFVVSSVGLTRAFRRHRGGV